MYQYDFVDHRKRLLDRLQEKLKDQYITLPGEQTKLKVISLRDVGWSDLKSKVELCLDKEELLRKETLLFFALGKDFSLQTEKDGLDVVSPEQLRTWLHDVP